MTYGILALYQSSSFRIGSMKPGSPDLRYPSATAGSRQTDAIRQRWWITARAVRHGLSSSILLDPVITMPRT